MDYSIIIEKAISRIASTYDLGIPLVREAIYGSEKPLDLEKMIDEGIFCFRGPDDNIRSDNASICLSGKILADRDVAGALLPVLCSRVMNWDREDIHVLCSDLKRIVSIMEFNPDGYPDVPSCELDISNLPSEKIPGDLRDRGDIWAMDKKGMCLVGIDANRVMHVDDIRKSASGA